MRKGEQEEKVKLGRIGNDEVERGKRAELVRLKGRTK